MSYFISPGTTNRFVTATVIIYFQRYPGIDSSSGIANVPYTLRVDGSVIQTGTTGTDGKAILNFAEDKTAMLEIFGSQYEIRIKERIESIRNCDGIQQRLNMLGYNAGKVDGVMGRNTDRAVLCFQADNAPLKIDGIPGNNTQTKLMNKVGE